MNRSKLKAFRIGRHRTSPRYQSRLLCSCLTTYQQDMIYVCHSTGLSNQKKVVCITIKPGSLPLYEARHHRQHVERARRVLSKCWYRGERKRLGILSKVSQGLDLNHWVLITTGNIESRMRGVGSNAKELSESGIDMSDGTPNNQDLQCQNMNLLLLHPIISNFRTLEESWSRKSRWGTFWLSSAWIKDYA